MLVEDKKDYYLQLFAKVEHGFALRGNQNDPYERKYVSGWRQVEMPLLLK